MKHKLNVVLFPKLKYLIVDFCQAEFIILNKFFGHFYILINVLSNKRRLPYAKRSLL